MKHAAPSHDRFEPILTDAKININVRFRRACKLLHGRKQLASI